MMMLAARRGGTKIRLSVLCAFSSLRRKEEDVGWLDDETIPSQPASVVGGGGK